MGTARIFVGDHFLLNIQFKVEVLSFEGDCLLRLQMVEAITTQETIQI